jgi:hypothetical protein
MTAVEPTSSAPAPQLPPAPRAITPRARRRSWNEAPVRAWIILAALVLVAVIIFTATQIVSGMQDRRLILQGVVVTATVRTINGVEMHKRGFDRREILNVTLDYTGPDAKSYSVQGQLAPADGVLHTGDTIPLHVDPSDAANWTDRTEPGSWWHELTVMWFLLPLLVIALALAWWRRQQALAAWRNGVPISAAVVETKHSAIAPRSRVVRYTLTEGNDRRVFSTLIPSNRAPLQNGDELILLSPPGRPSRAIVAELYND